MSRARRAVSVSLRAYDAARDGKAAYRLYRRSLGSRYPIERAEFGSIAPGGRIAVIDDRVVGVAALARDHDVASIQLLIVDPGLQGQGIGRALHDDCLAELRRHGVRLVGLAGLPGPCLWPGIPEELTEARTIFQGWGWSFGDPTWDLARSLIGYETPQAVLTRHDGQLTLRWATPADRAGLAEFERTHFPTWAAYFAEAETRAIIALERDAIVGSLLAHDRARGHWAGLRGNATGTVNVVGIAGAARRRGIGTRLVAYACEQLREQGVDDCVIRWTNELSFYGRLGFRPLRRYETASRRL